MDSLKVFIEIGRKKIFTGAVEWPGWCRSGRDEKTALQALIAYGTRYADILRRTDVEFQIPTDVSEFIVLERHQGNATTDFGAPTVILDVEKESLDQMAFERSLAILQACWQAFDQTVRQASGRQLIKGPRGGGRDLAKILNHVLEADQAYLTRLAWKHKMDVAEGPFIELNRMRQAIQNALEAAVSGGLPKQGPRGGMIWPPRYFIRRVAWHVLDHTWEMEDRMA
jgi:hypothetical protein